MLFNRCPSCNYTVTRSMPIDTLDSDDSQKDPSGIRKCPRCDKVLHSSEGSDTPMEQCDREDSVTTASNSGDQNPIILAQTDERGSVQPPIDSSLGDAVNLVNVGEDISDTIERHSTDPQPKNKTLLHSHLPDEPDSMVEIAGASGASKRQRNGSTMSIDGGNGHAVDKYMSNRLAKFLSNSEPAKCEEQIEDQHSRKKLYIAKNVREHSKPKRDAMIIERNRISRVEEQEKLYRQIIPEIVQNSHDERLILDIDRDTRVVRVEVVRYLVNELKPYQHRGIKFMYNSIIENVDKLDEPGSGCILAHELGSGKSLQVIALIHTLLTNRYTKDHLRRVLIITPAYNLQNWANEFDKWIVDKGLQQFNIDVIYGKSVVRPILLDWRGKGGIIVIGNNLFIESVMDCAKQDQDSIKMLNKLFNDPGPSLIVIDEAHLLGGQTKRMCQIINKMQTKRRILVTGTPLHNKLEDYYAMIELIKPQLLGSHFEFVKQFGALDTNHKHHPYIPKSSMILRINELQSLVSGSIQAFNQLELYLPPKYEFFISIRPSQRILKMYNFYKEFVSQKISNITTNPYRGDLSPLLRCLNHPFLSQSKKSVKESIHSGWHEQFIEPNDWMNNKLSGKFHTMFKILESCVRVGDKLVVISQSTDTLQLIGRVVEHKLRWKLNDDYFMIDKLEMAKRKVDALFNIHESSKLLLLCFRNFGIDLTAANRVIVFDVSWDPIEEDETIAAIYRLRQTKPVYVYRFVTEGTIEEEIYRKQIEKRKMINLIVDNTLEVTSWTATSFDVARLLNEQSSFYWHLDINDRLLADTLSCDDFVLNCVEVLSCWKKKLHTTENASLARISSRNNGTNPNAPVERAPSSGQETSNESSTSESQKLKDTL